MNVLMKPLIESRALSRSPQQVHGFPSERMNGHFSPSCALNHSDSLIVFACEGDEGAAEQCNLSAISCDSHGGTLDRKGMQGCPHRDTLTRLAALFDSETSPSEASSERGPVYSDDEDQPLLLPVDLQPHCEDRGGRQFLLDKRRYSERSVSCEESRRVERQNGWDASTAPNGGSCSPERLESDI